MILSTAILFWGAALSEPQADAAQETLDAIADSTRQTTPAVTIQKSPPRYPAIELNRRREAWVKITYCIDESGSPQNVSVLDSIGTPRFDNAAVDTVKKWKFEPALSNGEPAWQSRNEVYISFALYGDNKGAGKKFIRQYRKLNQFIDEKNLQAADDLFLKIYETNDLSLYELSKVWALRARYEVLSGDLYKLDMALHRATASSGEWIEKDSYIGLLKARIGVELRLGQYHAAFQTLDELSETAGDDSEDVLAFQPTVQKLQEMIDGDDILKIDAEVRTKDTCNTCNDSWGITPVRSNFALDNVQGKLESIEMRCDHKRFESVVSDLVEWHIPDAWGTCHVQIYGEPGTTFDFLLLPTI